MLNCSFTIGKDGYHFTESGLDYIYLLNGCECETDEDGDEIVTIHNIDVLFKTIARKILLHKPELCGQEVRFFRSLLQITQTQLAELMGVELRTVQLWEKAKDKAITLSSDHLLRMIVWEKFLDESQAVKFLEEHKHQREHYSVMRLIEADEQWQIAA